MCLLGGNTMKKLTVLIAFLMTMPLMAVPSLAIAQAAEEGFLEEVGVDFEEEFGCEEEEGSCGGGGGGTGGEEPHEVPEMSAGAGLAAIALLGGIFLIMRERNRRG